MEGPNIVKYLRMPKEKYDERRSYLRRKRVPCEIYQVLEAIHRQVLLRYHNPNYLIWFESPWRFSLKENNGDGVKEPEDYYQDILTYIADVEELGHKKYLSDLDTQSEKIRVAIEEAKRSGLEKEKDDANQEVVEVKYGFEGFWPVDLLTREIAVNNLNLAKIQSLAGPESVDVTKLTQEIKKQIKPGGRGLYGAYRETKDDNRAAEFRPGYDEFWRLYLASVANVFGPFLREHTEVGQVNDFISKKLKYEDWEYLDSSSTRTAVKMKACEMFTAEYINGRLKDKKNQNIIQNVAQFLKHENLVGEDFYEYLAERLEEDEILDELARLKD